MRSREQYRRPVRVGRIVGRAIGLMVLTVLAVGSMSTMAQAKGELHNWRSSSSPLVVAGYGSTGKAYGNWRVDDTSNGTRSILNARLWLNDADNHTVYAHWETWTNAGSCFAPDYTSCTQSYFFWAGDNSAHQNEESWQWHTNTTSLNPGADYARAHIRVRLDIPWRSDPASGWLFTTGTRY